MNEDYQQMEVQEEQKKSSLDVVKMYKEIYEYQGD